MQFPLNLQEQAVDCSPRLKCTMPFQIVQCAHCRTIHSRRVAWNHRETSRVGTMWPVADLPIYNQSPTQSGKREPASGHDFSGMALHIEAPPRGNKNL